jgi:hypothetical protein
VLVRFLFVRLGDPAIPPMAHALIILGGVLACAYADPSPEVFGPRLSAWTRACRHDKFWVPVLPDLATAERILKGDAVDAPSQ